MSTPDTPIKAPTSAIALIAIWLTELPQIYAATTGTLPGWCRIWMCIDGALWTLCVIAAAAKTNKPNPPEKDDA